MSDGGTIKIARAGDIDCGSQVSIDDIIKVVRMYRGQNPVELICDPGCDGMVQIFDEIKVINCYLETVDCGG